MCIRDSYMDCCVGGIVFWLLGFGLMFGANLTGWYGMSHFAPNDGEPWDHTFLLFQMMFAATAATIASGAMAERTRYGAYLIGAVLISGVIYPIFGSWVWGGLYGGCLLYTSRSSRRHRAVQHHRPGMAGAARGDGGALRRLNHAATDGKRTRAVQRQ